MWIYWVSAYRRGYSIALYGKVLDLAAQVANSYFTKFDLGIVILKAF
jgi:hypothetical protein